MPGYRCLSGRQVCIRGFVFIRGCCLHRHVSDELLMPMVAMVVVVVVALPVRAELHMSVHRAGEAALVCGTVCGTACGAICGVLLRAQLGGEP